MRKSNYDEVKVLSVLQQAEQGVGVNELRRGVGVSNAASFQWRSK